MSDGYVTLTWMDGQTETHYGHARILDTGGGVLQVIMTRHYGPDEIQVSVPMASLRKWTSSDQRPEDA